MTATAYFASLRTNLIVVQESAQPVFSQGRQIGESPGLYHRFEDHRCVVSGQKQIDYMRGRIKAADAPEMWELDATDVPEITELLAEMATADTDRIRDIIVAEEAGPARQIILETARAVLLRTGVSERKAGQKATVTA